MATSEIIKFPISEEEQLSNKRDAQRHQLMATLEDLIWEDPDAIYQLDNHCLNRHNQVDKRVKNLLIEKKIFDEDGFLTSLANEAMYELRTGQKPFWLP